MSNTKTAAPTEELLAKLATPAGYKLLIAMPEVEKTTVGGVYLPEGHRDAEGTASIIGYVIALGASAYKHPDKFPDGPWCKAGDFVIFRSYSGTRFKVDGREFRIINDDTVEAVVADPRGYSRA
jgi:chaperonin GroES